MPRTIKKLKHMVFNRPVHLQDEYIEWLSFANAGMLEKGNLYCFDYAIKHLPSTNPILEIGSFCGLSTNILTYLLKKYNRSNILLSADPWIFEGSQKQTIGDSNISHKDYRQFVKDSFLRNIEMFSAERKPHTFEMDSNSLFESWQKKSEVVDVFGRRVKLGAPISFCYIDGHHGYDYTRKDFENTDQFLEKNGFILFDDSADYEDFGSAQFMKDMKDNKNYKLIVKNPNYLFQKIL